MQRQANHAGGCAAAMINKKTSQYLWWKDVKSYWVVAAQIAGKPSIGVHARGALPIYTSSNDGKSRNLFLSLDDVGQLSSSTPADPC